MDRLSLLAASLLGAIAVLGGVAGLLWLAVVTAGSREAFDANPAVIAMGIPSHER